MKIPPANKNKSFKCGDCPKFSKCKEKYKVHNISRACVKYTGSENTIPTNDTDAVRDTPFFIKLRKKIKHRFSIDSLEDEIIRMGSFGKDSLGFDYHFLKPDSTFVKIQKALEQAQAYRSRINEIMMSATTMIHGEHGLNWLYTIAEGKIQEAYNSVYSSAKTSRDREIITSTILRELDAKIAKIENIVNMGEKSIKNLDQLHWTLRSFIDIGKTLIEHRNTTIGMRK